MTPSKRAAAHEPTREDLRAEERAIGANIPDEMVGLDSEDAADVERHEKRAQAAREPEKA